MIQKILRILIILLVIAAAVIGGMKLIKAKRAKEASTPVAKVYPVLIQSMVPKVSDVSLSLPFLATSMNEEDVTLSSRLSGRVEMIKKSGQSVKKGEILAKLDTTDLMAEIKAAKISLVNLQKSHARTKALYRVKGASIEQLQKEQSGIASLQAKLKALQNQLSYATLEAPVDGTIAKAFVTEGTVAMPGKPLLQINADEGFSLVVRSPSDIHPKALVYEDKVYPLFALGSTFHGLNEYKAFVHVPGLTTGERVSIDVIVYQGKNVKLPFDAILNRNGKSYILLIDGDHAKAQEVHVLYSGQEGIVVKENVAGKQLIVAKPDIMLKLLSGHALKVKE
jgi:biotin carboxyl carrier protein